MHPMSCNDPEAQNYQAEIRKLKKEMKELRIKSARYDWLEANAKEVYVRPGLVNCEWAPDNRTRWEIPTLICSGPIGGMMSFGESIDIMRKAKC